MLTSIKSALNSLIRKVNQSPTERYLNLASDLHDLEYRLRQVQTGNHLPMSNQQSHFN